MNNNTKSGRKKLTAKQHRKRNALKITLICLLAVLAVVIGGVVLVFEHFYSRTNFISESMEDDGIEVADYAQSEDGVYNLLLIGVDKRDYNGKYAGNSDVMMLMSINSNTKKVHLMSFMRDLYADIDGHGVHKLNAACSYGGPKLLISTIEKNYKVGIDNYAMVDFDDMVNIIDTMGGVDIDVTGDEVPVLNQYLEELTALDGTRLSDYTLSRGGHLHLNGKQAVAYCRIRYVGNADYQRTERQRTVMTQLLGKFSGKNAIELGSLADKLLPYITHNVSQGEVLNMITKIPSIAKFQVVQERIPYDNHYTSSEEILVPDMDYTIRQIQNDLNG